ncbi:hypothetical protein Snoj_42210 [Streptomyces nojiriensis]|uniref:Uncharacterized protein n=1 Tax=Streptomyces nojiriensis TaxID=66374 RepID=A0ABQ3SQ88_9ACTN|nr:hypothetical protein [Streptomyces nojiriensis]QTI43838.1 hypothetical protein JYK04_01601 [Streptomyces nojiriensis]GGR84095.1 hypothetical protein GCM10010205_10870 [Streptomyces nojiriensis]GHI70303.1 hypothetical protein Snoj_42210 [Streptomyces nojiriensis]
MVVGGDDGPARRLASELQEVYKERGTLVAPAGDAQPSVGRAPGCPAGERPPAREPWVLEMAEPDEEVLAAAGVAGAAALALVYEDDETNVRAALVARRLPPFVTSAPHPGQAVISPPQPW